MSISDSSKKILLQAATKAALKALTKDSEAPSSDAQTTPFLKQHPTEPQPDSQDGSPSTTPPSTLKTVSGGILNALKGTSAELIDDQVTKGVLLLKQTLESQRILTLDAVAEQRRLFVNDLEKAVERQRTEAMQQMEVQVKSITQRLLIASVIVGTSLLALAASLSLH